MSGWIKLEKDLESDPRVQRMALRIAATDVTHQRIGYANAVTQVVGGLARLWIFADTHAREDDTIDITPTELDDWLGMPGFCAAMPHDWLVDRGDGTLELPGFQAHNGVEAKKRALTQKRVALHRKRKPVTRANASALPDQTRPRPEETKTRKRGSGGDPLQIPVGLDLHAWQRWLDYRSSIRKPIKAASLQAAAEALVKHGTDQAAVVEQSVAHGWQGLFPLKQTNGSTPHAEPRLTRYEQSRRALEAATMTEDEEAARGAQT